MTAQVTQSSPPVERRALAAIAAIDKVRLPKASNGCERRLLDKARVCFEHVLELNELPNPLTINISQVINLQPMEGVSRIAMTFDVTKGTKEAFDLGIGFLTLANACKVSK